MADNTKIEWTDATWNPLLGCTKVSPGCDRCYAITNARIRAGNPNPKIATAYADLVDRNETGELDWTGRINLLPERLYQPLRWKRGRRIFVNSQSDLFHAGVPDDYIAQVFAVMALAAHHTFQVLTKRHARMRSLLSSDDFTAAVRTWVGTLLNDPATPYSRGAMRVLPERSAATWSPLPPWPVRNVWLGVSVEDQHWADIRIPALLDTPAAVRFLSCEPLLGPVDLVPPLRTWADGAAIQINQHLHWVIGGGESGSGARPAHPDWFRCLRDQCEAAGVAYHHKQNGVYVATMPTVADDSRPDGQAPDWDRKPDLWLEHDGRTVPTEASVPDTGTWTAMYRIGKKAAGRELDGRTWDEYPQPARRDVNQVAVAASTTARTEETR